jgi:hypothetical protein
LRSASLEERPGRQDFRSASLEERPGWQDFRSASLEANAEAQGLRLDSSNPFSNVRKTCFSFSTCGGRSGWGGIKNKQLDQKVNKR